MIFHSLQPPLYEAKTALLVNLDVIRYHLTPEEEYRVIDTVSNIVNSHQVQARVVAQASSSLGYSLTVEEFQRRASLERRRWMLEMYIRDRDPVLAAAMVDLWAVIAYQTLTQAQEHALRAYQIQRQMEGWLACLPGYVTPTPEPLTQQISLVPAWNENCLNYSPEAIEASLARLSNTLLTQEGASLGLAPFVEFTPPEKALVPGRPVLYDRGTLVLAGGIVGFLLAVWALSFWRGKA